MVVKQIRLKNTTEKIFSCGDCPWCCAKYMQCDLLDRILENMTINTDCPLEDYDDTNTDLGFI